MIVILRGTACSGKDTFIEKYFKGEVVLSSDDFRKLLFDDVNVQRYNKKVSSLMDDILKSRLEFFSELTVLNLTSLRIKDVRNFIEMAKHYKTKVLMVSIIPPSIDELVRRDELRAQKTGKYIGREALERHHTRYFDAKSAFEEESAYNPYFNMIEIDQNYEVVNDYSTD